MADLDYPIVRGDFHVIRMNGMFHAVFRPDSDPEWFRIIASFYSYHRAWSYCDIERVMVYEKDTETAIEETQGLCAAPVVETPGSNNHAENALLIRQIYEGERIEPHPQEDFSDHPEDREAPEDYRNRIYADAIAKQADIEAPAPTAIPPDVADDRLTDQQAAVLEVLTATANPEGMASLSLSKIAQRAGVPHGSISFLLESLERKRLMSVVERGRAGQTTIYRVGLPEGCAPTGGPTCKTCGKPRAPGGAGQCRACYENPPQSIALQ